jgi:hypothetical protein
MKMLVACSAGYFVVSMDPLKMSRFKFKKLNVSSCFEFL